MCHSPDLPGPLQKIHQYIRALHCPTRWDIIRCIGTGERSTKEIYELLGLGEEMSPAGLYYHLSALKQAGIVEVASYREVGAGTPEKIWRLKTHRIVIDLLEEEVE
ncbi:MAG: Helix-turn-helix domain protein [Methanosaeta sp. PtaB.Bin018]|nr:helix-turn-helix transcriptional regulator [Methanothrix sp.]OPX76265.1 MAG: Helix-turn-helix domain protein [Methanosaeta sp. PtaB.Bin018]